MMSKFILLCFVFFLGCSHLLLSSSFSNSTKLCPHGQALVLLQLKNSFSVMHGSGFWYCAKYGGTTSYPKTEHWKKGSDCCSWDGVTCDLLTAHVIELDLSCSWLGGTINSSSTEPQPSFQQLQWVLCFSWVWSVLKLDASQSLLLMVQSRGIDHRLGRS